MSKRLRLILTIIILTLSIFLLVWGYLPNPHVTLERIILPAEMQIPTP
ncbi:MAG TPA: hypothetical protein VJL10_05675 [Anaerolineales bacterium]|nr:hypothetical protein [Anaerolineales bacterium]